MANAARRVYNYHPHTGVFIDTSDPIMCPLERGVILIPAHATLQPLPDYDAETQLAVFSEADGAWTIKEKPAPHPPQPYPPIDWTHIRNERNGRLFMSDHIFVLDSPYSTEMTNAWRKYRQELRNIPETFAGAKTMVDVIWPTPPPSTASSEKIENGSGVGASGN